MRVHFLLKSEIHEKAKRIAESRGQNFSEWMRGLIASELEDKTRNINIEKEEK